MVAEIVIIGGGAAGLMAAAQSENSNVILLEKNSRPARKVMITGKGRCNVTNNCDEASLIANVTANGRFLYSAFSAFNSQDTMQFFENQGVQLKTERGNRVFPVSDKALDIVDALVKAAKKNGTKILSATALEILTDDGKVLGVRTDDGEIYSADKVIIATGGCSYPLTGSTGDGYDFAKSVGHTITKISPSLVSLKVHEGFCERLAGLSLKNVTLSVFEQGKKKPVFRELGEMIFTHQGISGPLVLSASAHLRDIGKREYTAVLDLKPALDNAQLEKRILRDFSEELNCDFINSLGKLLPKSIIPIVINLSGIPPRTKVNQISREQRQSLVSVLKGMALHITGTGPIEEAVITRGGVSVKEINPATMESKLIKGLYFAGEVIDVDAYTGGFNLQIAFSTGYVAAKSASKGE